MTRVTQGVVTPNIVRPIDGLPSSRRDRAAAMPAMAKAALRSTIRLTLLRPARSVIDGIIIMSETSTKGATSPEASVETIIFGRPIGSARMPRVMIEVPPPPPIPMIASNPSAP